MPGPTTIQIIELATRQVPLAKGRSRRCLAADSISRANGALLAAIEAAVLTVR